MCWNEMDEVTSGETIQHVWNGGMLSEALKVRGLRMFGHIYL